MALQKKYTPILLKLLLCFLFTQISFAQFDIPEKPEFQTSVYDYANVLAADEKAKLRSHILKRSWFLLSIGLLLFTWWPGDILHFYGGYMHIAAFILFVPKRYYLWIASIVILKQAGHRIQQ